MTCEWQPMATIASIKWRTRVLVVYKGYTFMGSYIRHPYNFLVPCISHGSGWTPVAECDWWMPVPAAPNK